MRIIGMTGNREGLTKEARSVLEQLLVKLNPKEAHHGDCVGADAEFHELVVGKMRVIIHPPDNPSKRARCKGYTEIREEKSYLERNKAIVNESQILIGLPVNCIEYARSGTWSTIRYARKIGRPIIIILPTGQVKLERLKFTE